MNNITSLKRLIADLAIDNWRLKAEIEDKNASLTLQGDLNRKAAKALGKPFEGEGSSWHDIPEQITKLRKEYAQLLKRPTTTEYDDLKVCYEILSKQHAGIVKHMGRLEGLLRERGMLK